MTGPYYTTTYSPQHGTTYESLTDALNYIIASAGSGIQLYKVFDYKKEYAIYFATRNTIPDDGKQHTTSGSGYFVYDTSPYQIQNSRITLNPYEDNTYSPDNATKMASITSSRSRFDSYSEA